MTRTSLIAFVVLCLAVPALAAPPVPWTASVAAAELDESSRPLAAYSMPYLSFAPGGAIGVISAYFNVTDTTGTAFPGWTTLEITSVHNGPSSMVSAVLFQVDRCTGKVTSLCGLNGNLGAAPSCARCTLSGPVDFDKYYYYVWAQLYRSNPAEDPKLYGVRLF